jgi:hypothetical protein
MKVFVVFWEDTDYFRVLDSVFDDEQKAIDRVNELMDRADCEHAEYNECEVE